MARKTRYNISGYPQHIVQRGNNRQLCFFSDEDRLFYLECINDSAQKYDCEVHAYVLMSNHVHLLITPHLETGISSMMQSIGRRYVRYINSYYHRSGTLWEGRYKASLVDSDNYVLACYRYIEQNPVRATMVNDPAQYRWSSHLHNIGQRHDPLITAHPTYLNLATDAKSRAANYRDIFHDNKGTSELNTIRATINKNQVLAEPNAIPKLEKILNRRVREGLPGRPRKNLL